MRGLAVVVAVVSVLVAASAADAKARPRVSLTVPSVIEAGSAYSAQWHVSHVPHGARIYIQKPVGTAKIWQPIAPKLTGTGGSIALPAFAALGVYQVRIAAILRGKVVASQARVARVFANVPFSNLLAHLEAGTFVEAKVAFPYAAFAFISVSGGGEGSNSGAIKVAHSTCDRVRLEFVGAEASKQEPGSITATLVRQTQEPVSATQPNPNVGILEAPVTIGQSWGVNFTLSGVPGLLIVGYHAFFNGTAHCYSRSTLENRNE
jgi:hypothetical protein